MPSAAAHVVDHPAAAELLARLRDISTGPEAFRDAATRLGAVLALEATSDIPTHDVTIESPLGPASGRRIARAIVAVPVLRAGLGLLSGVELVLPRLSVGMVGLERDDVTLRPRRYYEKFPPLAGAWVLVLEPMLATGGSAAAAVSAVVEEAERVVVLAVVATPRSLEAVGEVAPDVRVVTAALDPRLDDNGYIVPGLGDFGDRLWGTPHA
ncbi:MAG: uracil phosphoribosyltransferase [Actinobacteria bacterium]|nr:uracil phosphoribosyltransferase [Actinomycetota bacterium]